MLCTLNWRHTFSKGVEGESKQESRCDAVNQCIPWFTAPLILRIFRFGKPVRRKLSQKKDWIILFFIFFWNSIWKQYLKSRPFGSGRVRWDPKIRVNLSQKFFIGIDVNSPRLCHGSSLRTENIAEPFCDVMLFLNTKKIFKNTFKCISQKRKSSEIT